MLSDCVYCMHVLCRMILWTTCALSGLPLVAPIVADALGQLFNKQSVLEHLLAAKAAAAGASAAAAADSPAQPAGAMLPAAGLRSSSSHSTAPGSIVPYSVPTAVPSPPKDLAAACLRYENQQRMAAAAAAASGDAAAASQGTFDHIKSLKDVFAVQLTPNPDAAPQKAGPPAGAGGSAQGLPAQGGTHRCQQGSSSSCGELPSPWMCPITLQPCGSKQAFSALRPCGHVLSHKAIAAIIACAGPSTAGGKPSSGALLHQHQKASQVMQSEQLSLDDEGRLDGDAGSCHACCCPVCEAPFVPGKDQVLINGSQQHMDEVRVQLREAAAAKAQAKQKKRKRATGAELLQQQPPRPLASPASS